MRIIADLHLHTVACPHGHGSLEGYIETAKARGLYAIGVSEHVQAFPDGVPMSYLEGMANWPEEINGIRLFRGVETDINDFRGRIWLQRRYMKTLDYCIASAHRSSLRNADKDTVTRMWCGIAELPEVDIIGHCGREHNRFPFELEPVLRAFAKGGKTVEINNESLDNPDQRAACARIAELCVKYSIPVMIGSDSHFSETVGKFDRALQLIQEVRIPEELIVNADEDRLSAWVAEHRRRHAAG